VFIKVRTEDSIQELINVEIIRQVRIRPDGSTVLKFMDGGCITCLDSLDEIERQLSVEKRARARYKRERTRFVSYVKEKYKAVKAKISEATADKPEE
jgi:uncharacterized protein YlzI (FlbEa/FlbD family)